MLGNFELFCRPMNMCIIMRRDLMQLAFSSLVVKIHYFSRFLHLYYTFSLTIEIFSVVYLYLYITWQYALLCSRHGSNITRPVIIHDIIHSLYMCQVLHIVDFLGVSPDENCAYVHLGSFTSNSKSVRRAICLTWFSEPHETTSLHVCPSVYNTWQSQAVTHPIMNCCLTSVIESTPMS